MVNFMTQVYCNELFIIRCMNYIFVHIRIISRAAPGWQRSIQYFLMFILGLRINQNASYKTTRL